MIDAGSRNSDWNQPELSSNQRGIWLYLWYLSIHRTKTVCMVFRSEGMPPCLLNIKINDNHITLTSRHRHVAVTFNERLSLKDHVHDVINMSRKKLDSSVALAGNCLQPLSGIFMHSASDLDLNMAASSGAREASVSQMLHASGYSTEERPG